MREGIVFYRSFYEAVKDLPAEQFKATVSAIMDYGLDGKMPETCGIERTIFLLTKPQIDANNKKYQNGSKGGRPAKYSKEENEEARKARNSQEYLKWRDEVYKRDGYSCVICGSEDNIEAHHKKGFVEFPELRYEVSNGITLCEQCHNQIHNSNNQKKPNINFSEPSDNQKKPNVDFSEPKEKEKEKEKDKEKQILCDARTMFERLWDRYPLKRGKGQVSDTQKKRLLAIGEAKLVKAIERYSLELQQDAGWRKTQNGSTFFNSGYMDYLDEEWEKSHPGSIPVIPAAESQDMMADEEEEQAVDYGWED